MSTACTTSESTETEAPATALVPAVTTSLVATPPPLARPEPPMPVTDRDKQLRFLAYHAAASGMFKKFGNASAALMVMKFGDDLGLSPTTSLTSIHFFEGKPTMSGNLMWSLVMANKEWQDSEITQHDATGVNIVWRKNGKQKGTSSHNDVDSKREGVFGKLNYAKYPEAMHFNRAVSKGFKMFTPHLANGYTLYTPDEMGMKIDSSGEAVIEDAEFTTRGVSPQGEAGAPTPNWTRMHQALVGLDWTAAQASETIGLNLEALTNPTEAEAGRIAMLLEARLQVIRAAAQKKKS